jgi:hypothetical protein
MDSRSSTPNAAEKQVPASNRRRVGVFIIAGLIGLALGVLGGIGAGFISMLMGNALYPSLGLESLALLLGPIIIFPIAGLCTGLVTATQRSVERGSVVGAVIFGGSQLVLSIPSIAEFWMVMASVVVMAAVLGAVIGAMSAGVSAAAYPDSSAQNHATPDAGK